MSETKTEYLQGEREAEIKKSLREETIIELLDRIPNSDEELKEIIIDHIIEKGYYNDN